MTNKEEIFLSLSYWVASLDGNVDLDETSNISESEFFKSYYSQKNFKHCKSKVDKIKESNDAQAFLKQLLEPLPKTKFQKEEKINLVNELCKVASADNNFEDLEKKYINLLASELGIQEEKIVENYETNLVVKSKEASPGLKLNAKELKAAFDCKEAEVTAIVRQKIQKQIEKELSIEGFTILVNELKIRKTERLSVHTLYDSREVEERTEINYSGSKEIRGKSSSQINLYEEECISGLPHRNDYDFKNLSSNIKYRVLGTNETRTCYSCKGRKQVTCYTCRGARELRCDNCSGRGQNKCSSCYGSGWNDCLWCSSGYKEEYDSRLGRSVRKRCNSCSGQGRNPCSSCQSGWVTCNRCSGAGKITCYTCSGMGLVDCSSCSAQGSFTDFLQISSTLEKISTSTFLNEEPDKNFCHKTLFSEQNDYHKLFGKYEFKDLKKYSSEIKNLFVQQKFSKSQRPQIIKFNLDDCLSMSFKIIVGDNIYLGGLKPGGEIFYDKTILDQLFFNIIKTLDVDNKFKSLETIKTPITVQIPEFKNTFDKMTQYKSFVNIINSKNKEEIKLNKVRKLAKINTTKYTDYLILNIKKSVQKIILPLLVFVHLILCLLFPPWQILFLISFITSIIISTWQYTKHLKTKNQDATKTKSKGITFAAITSLISIGIILLINNSANKGFIDDYGTAFDEIIWETFLEGNSESNDYGIEVWQLPPDERYYALPYFDPFNVSEFGWNIFSESPDEMNKRLSTDLANIAEEFTNDFTFISCSECEDDSVRTGSSYSKRRANGGQDGEYGWGAPDTWNQKSLEERVKYNIPQFDWRWEGKKIDKKIINLVNEETFAAFKSQFLVVHRDEIINKAKISYDSYELSWSDTRKYAIENLLTDSLIIIKPSNTKVNYHYVDEGTSWSCLKCSGYVCRKCTNTTRSNRSGTTNEKTYLRLSDAKFFDLNTSNYTYGWDDYSVGGPGDNFFAAQDVSEGFMDNNKSYSFYSKYANTLGKSDIDDWNTLRGMSVRSYQDSEEVNRFNFVFPSEKVKRESGSDYGIYIMQNDLESFKRMLLSSAILPDPSKNPRTRNDGRDFFNHRFYINVVHEIDENMGTIQTNPAYDFYHMLVNEGTFRKLFKRSAQNYINQSKEYVVQ